MKRLRLWLVLTGVLIAVHVFLGNFEAVVEDIVLVLVLVEYYRYRSTIEHFDEQIRLPTHDGG